MYLVVSDQCWGSALEVRGCTHQQQLEAWTQGGAPAPSPVQLWAPPSYCSFS